MDNTVINNPILKTADDLYEQNKLSDYEFLMICLNVERNEILRATKDKISWLAEVTEGQ